MVFKVAEVSKKWRCTKPRRRDKFNSLESDGDIFFSTFLVVHDVANYLQPKKSINRMCIKRAKAV